MTVTLLDLVENEEDLAQHLDLCVELRARRSPTAGGGSIGLRELAVHRE